MKLIPVLIMMLNMSMVSSAQNKLNNKAKTEIRTELARQQKCWNNADLDCFMDGYWKSDSLKFIGKTGINYGWKNTLNNYRKSYPDPTAMGKLEFDILNVELLEKDHALVTGKWKLIREEDTPNGIFTLIWKNIHGEWKIIYDHTS